MYKLSPPMDCSLDFLNFDFLKVQNEIYLKFDFDIHWFSRKKSYDFSKLARFRKNQKILEMLIYQGFYNGANFR